MVRHFISTVALVVCATVYAFAGEHATFILSNGDRISGELPAGTNFVDGQLKLADQSVGIDQVAIIDVIGGTPSELELSRVAYGTGQAVVLRNGHAQAGKFVNITGDTLQWETERGQAEQYPLRNVARIYLKPSNARAALHSSNKQTTPVGTSGHATPQTQDLPGGIRVHANQPWTDTGIQVRVGDLVSFQTSGQIAFARGGADTFAGPDGKGDMQSPNYPVSVMPLGGLIAKVDNSAPFPIGSNTQPIRMPTNGRLMLGVNDNEVSDNSGHFSVVVTKTGQRR